MNISAELKKATTAPENCQNTKPDTSAEKTKGFLGCYLVVPVKNATRHIADGVCAFCRNIRSFLITVCSPVCSPVCYRRDGSESSRDAEDTDPYASSFDTYYETADDWENSGLEFPCGTAALSGKQSQLSSENGTGWGSRVVATVSGEEAAVMADGSSLREESLGAARNTAMAGELYDAANESADASSEESDTSDESLPYVVPPEAPATSGVAGLSMVPLTGDMAISEMKRNQSVFTLPYFAGSAYNQIREFLLANPELSSNFPKERIVEGERQRQWGDLDFQQARLMVRDTGYLRSYGGPKKPADKAFFPLVGAEFFQNDLERDRRVCISQCPDTFARQWLQCKDAPGIFLVNYYLRNQNMVFYYAVPELDAIEESCRPLLERLVSNNPGELQNVMEKFKVISTVADLSDAFSSMVATVNRPAVMNNKFELEGYCGESPDGGNRYTEVHIDLRNSKQTFFRSLYWSSLSQVNKLAQSVHMFIGFAIEPLAEDDRINQEKKTKTSIDNFLPEYIFAGIELFYPDITTQEPPKLQPPFPATFFRQ